MSKIKTPSNEFLWLVAVGISITHRSFTPLHSSQKAALLTAYILLNTTSGTFLDFNL